MDRKGFTLVELLAVIVILTLLALITTISVTSVVTKSKKELSSTQIELIKSAAKIWGAENISKLPDSGQCSYITLGDLKKYGLLENDVNDPIDNRPILDELQIKITNTKKNNKQVIDYEVNPVSVTGCEQVYTEG